ncbi:NUDIX domain-containing protein, partial [Candidatus Woesearchaeota archaeon]|nr:NUDIX domain-containing protein [Candidatus Woesearchaeota archaeon]
MTGANMQYEIIEEAAAFKGFFSLLKYRLRHTLYKGGWSAVISRELFHRGDCVAVIPYDPILDRVILIEQFRIGAIKTSPVPWLWEIVAGAIEEGETPEAVAHRETFEEAGCSIRQLIRIGRFYPTPGGCSETITLFCALVDAPDAEGFYG